MIAFCYTRAESAEKAEQVRKAMAAWCGKRGSNFAGFWWDAMSGQRGLMTALKNAEQADVIPKGIVVDHLSDLARDLPGLVKQIAILLEKGIVVYSIATDLMFCPEEPNDKEPRVISALAAAHIRYTSDNRKRGIASAREAGATIGRPTLFTLDGCRKTIKDLTDSNKGRLPSVRKLAEKVGCGHTKAGELLKEYANERNADPEHEAAS